MSYRVVIRTMTETGKLGRGGILVENGSALVHYACGGVLQVAGERPRLGIQI